MSKAIIDHMKFEELFAKLDRLIADKSNDFTEMRRLLQEIWDTKEIYRWLDRSQDRLYASIATGHLKVLHHLEIGDVERAKQEAAAAIAWFHLRFRGFEQLAHECPEVAETFRRVEEQAARSPTLRAALQKPSDEIASKYSPGGER